MSLGSHELLANTTSRRPVSFNLIDFSLLVIGTSYRFPHVLYLEHTSQLFQFVGCGIFTIILSRYVSSNRPLIGLMHSPVKSLYAFTMPLLPSSSNTTVILFLIWAYNLPKNAAGVPLQLQKINLQLNKVSVAHTINSTRFLAIPQTHNHHYSLSLQKQNHCLSINVVNNCSLFDDKPQLHTWYKSAGQFHTHQ